MTTRQREWPNGAKAARDEAAERLQEIVNELKPMVEEKPLTSDAIYRRCARAHARALEALLWLKSAGACTRPVE